MRTVLIICFVLALVLFYSVSGLTQDDTTPTAISSRIAELTPPDKDIPDNPIVLADEIRQINEELEETRKSEDSLQRQIKSLNLTKDRANKALQEITALDCNASPPNLPSLMDEIDRVALRWQIRSTTTPSVHGPTCPRETSAPSRRKSSARS